MCFDVINCLKDTMLYAKQTMQHNRNLDTYYSVESPKGVTKVMMIKE
jgi:hypothetical protein